VDEDDILDTILDEAHEAEDILDVDIDLGGVDLEAQAPIEHDAPFLVSPAPTLSDFVVSAKPAYNAKSLVKGQYFSKESTDKYAITLDRLIDKKTNSLYSLNSLDDAIAHAIFDDSFVPSDPNFVDIVFSNNFNSIESLVANVSYSLVDYVFDAWIENLVSSLVGNLHNLASQDNDNINLEMNLVDFDSIVVAYEEINPSAAKHVKTATTKFFGDVSELKVLTLEVDNFTLSSVVNHNLFPPALDLMHNSFAQLKDYNSFTNINNEEVTIPIVRNRIYALLMLGLVTKKLYLLDFTKDHITFAYNPNNTGVRSELTTYSAETLREFVNEYGDCLRLSDDNLLLSLSAIVSIWRENLYTLYQRRIRDKVFHLCLEVCLDKFEENENILRNQLKEAEINSGNIEGFGWS